MGYHFYGYYYLYDYLLLLAWMFVWMLLCGCLFSFILNACIFIVCMGVCYCLYEYYFMDICYLYRLLFVLGVYIGYFLSFVGVFVLKLAFCTLFIFLSCTFIASKIVCMHSVFFPCIMRVLKMYICNKYMSPPKYISIFCTMDAVIV